MKKSVINFVMALALCASMSVMALASDKGELSFRQDTNVNGTVVKKGNYKVTFDSTTNELTIWQGKNAVVKATARVENRNNKVSNTTMQYSQKNNEKVLTSITLGGSDQTLVIEGSDAKTTSPVPPTLPSLGLSLLSSIQ